MVTYLVKQPFGRRNPPSREGTQLEAYCSAIGKVLLAQLEVEEVDLYLGESSFVPLTPATITDASVLKGLLGEVRAQGWAIELGETMPDLSCIAVPVLDSAGSGRAALSVSIQGRIGGPSLLLAMLPALQRAAIAIRARVFDRSSGTRV